MTLDQDTLTLALGLTTLLQSASLQVQRKSMQPYAGMDFWAWGNALLAFGVLLTLAPPAHTVGQVAIYLGHLALVAAAGLGYIAAARFVGRLLAWPGLILVATAGLFTITYFALWQPNPTWNLLVTLSLMAVLAFMTAHALFVYRVGQVARTSTALASVMLGYGLLLLILAISLIIVPTTDPAWVGHANVSLRLATLVASALWTFIVLFMVHQRAAAELREARDEQERMFNAIPDASLINRLSDGAYVQVNDEFTSLIGLSRADVIGRYTPRIDVWNDPADRRRVVTGLRIQDSLTNVGVTFKRGDGKTFPGSLSAKILDLRGEPCLVSSIRAESPESSSRTKSVTLDEHYRLLSDHGGDVIWTCGPDRRFDYVSTSAKRLLGCNPENLIGRSLDALVSPVAHGVLHDAMEAMLRESPAAPDGSTRAFEFDQVTQDGKTLATQTRLRLERDESGEPTFIAVMRDVSEQKRLRDELSRQTTVDELTGAYNRRHFLTLARQEIKRAIRRRRALALALIDVDRFRLLNETYGQTTGDQALSALTRFFRANLRSIDVFARFGGDQFAILLPESNRQEAIRALERIRARLTEEPMLLDGHRVSMSISAGLASLEDGENSLEGLLRRADMALFQMKRAGRNRVGFSEEPY